MDKELINYKKVVKIELQKNLQMNMETANVNTKEDNLIIN